MQEKINTLTIYRTDDYQVFKKLSGNREYNNSHIKRLVKLVSANPEFTLVSPVMVNEKMQVIDGQHRVEAFIQHNKVTGLKYPIYFVVREGLTLNDARSLNSGSKPWTPRNYAEAFTKQGKEDYATYLKYSANTQLNHDILVRYLAPSDYSMQTFRDGLFKVENETASKKHFAHLSEIGEVLKEHIDPDHRSFAIALLTLMENKQYDHERMVAQLEAYGKSLRTVPMKNKDIAEALQAIYNKNKEDKIFLVD